MTLDDIKSELDRTITVCNDLFRTRLIIRAYKADNIPCRGNTLSRLQEACDDYCTALSNVIAESKGGKE